jgi:hypothetical protein
MAEIEIAAGLQQRPSQADLAALKNEAGEAVWRPESCATGLETRVG